MIKVYRKHEVSTYHGIQIIPANYLVDPNGVIIARNLRGEALHEKLKELMNLKCKYYKKAVWVNPDSFFMQV